jgi:hypothetical protein
MEELIPSKYFLSQNFPNPFTDETKIKYCLPIRTKVNLTVYNSDGVKVKELVNKIQEAGTYEVKLSSHSGEGRNLIAGPYYYTIQANDLSSNTLKGQTGQKFIETKKMILIK